MTIDEAIKLIDTMLPGNRFDSTTKTIWLFEMDGKIFEELKIGNRLLKEMPWSLKRVLNPPAIIFWWKQGDRWTNQLLEEAKQPEDPNEDNESDDHNYARWINPLNMIPPRPQIIRNELKPYTYAGDSQRQLIAPDRFSDVYTHYVIAKMHAADSEIEEYNNEVLLYTAAIQDFYGWYLRSYGQEGPAGYIF